MLMVVVREDVCVGEDVSVAETVCVELSSVMGPIDGHSVRALFF